MQKKHIRSQKSYQLLDRIICAFQTLPVIKVNFLSCCLTWDFYNFNDFPLSHIYDKTIEFLNFAPLWDYLQPHSSPQSINMIQTDTTCSSNSLNVTLTKENEPTFKNTVLLLYGNDLLKEHPPGPTPSFHQSVSPPLCNQVCLWAISSANHSREGMVKQNESSPMWAIILRGSSSLALPPASHVAGCQWRMWWDPPWAEANDDRRYTGNGLNLPPHIGDVNSTARAMFHLQVY